MGAVLKLSDCLCNSQICGNTFPGVGTAKSGIQAAIPGTCPSSLGFTGRIPQDTRRAV
jgi:hypothetical protein